MKNLSQISGLSLALLVSGALLVSFKPTLGAVLLLTGLVSVPTISAWQKHYRWDLQSQLVSLVALIFGVILILAGLGSFLGSESNPPAGTALLLIGLTLIPVSSRWLEEQLNFPLTAKTKAVLIPVLLAAFVYFTTDTPKLDNTASQISNNTTQILNETLPFADSQVTRNSVRAALQNINDSGYRIKLDNIKQIEITGSTPEYAVSIRYKPKSVWDSRDGVNVAARTATEIFERLFANRSVKRVSVFQLGDFTDTYGQTNEEVAVKVMMDRETADKINWEGFKNQVRLDYRALERVASDFNIHPALKSEL